MHRLHKRKSIVFLILDILLVALVLTLMTWSKSANINSALPKHIFPFLYFIFIWILTSLLAQKYNFQVEKSSSSKIISLFISNIAVLAVTLSLLTHLQVTEYSSVKVLSAIGSVTIVEIILMWHFITDQNINHFFLSRKIKNDIIITE